MDLRQHGSSYKEIQLEATIRSGSSRAHGLLCALSRWQTRSRASTWGDPGYAPPSPCACSGHAPPTRDNGFRDATAVLVLALARCSTLHTRPFHLYARLLSVPGFFSHSFAPWPPLCRLMCTSRSIPACAQSSLNCAPNQPMHEKRRLSSTKLQQSWQSRRLQASRSLRVVQ